MRKFTKTLIVGMAILLAQIVIQGQTTTGSLTGTVTDPRFRGHCGCHRHGNQRQYGCRAHWSNQQLWSIRFPDSAARHIHYYC